VDKMPEVEPDSPSVWPATFLALLGGALAIASIRFEHFGTDFAACACLLLSWHLTRSLGQDNLADHPLGKRSTRGLLLGFAALAALIGTMRLIRAG
jgi:hypothetical protein